MLIEAKDIDEITDKTDILCAFQPQFDVELPESAVVRLRAAYGGTQAATNARTSGGLWKGLGVNEIPLDKPKPL